MNFQRFLLLLIWTLAWSYGFAFAVSSWYYESIGMTPGDIQQLRAFFMFSCLLFAPLGGILADWLGRRALCTVGSLSLFAASGCYVLCTAVWQVYLAEVVIAFGQACLIGSVPALLCRAFRVGRERTFAQVWGWALLIEACYWVAINASGGFIAKEFGVRSPWVVATGLYGVLVLLSLLVKNDPSAGEDDAGAAEVEAVKSFTLGDVRTLLARPTVWRSLILFGALSASYRGVMYLEPEYLKQSGFSKEVVGLIIGMSYIPVGIVAVCAGRSHKLLSAKSTEPALFGAQSLAFLLMAAFFGGPGWLAVLIHTMVRGVSRVKYFAEANGVCDEICRGSCNGLLNFADRLGGVILLTTVGVFLDRAGLTMTLYGLSLLILVIGLLCVLPRRDR